MPTKDIMTQLLTNLGSPELALTQAEAYEGQFEDIAEALIVPPAAFVAIEGAINETQQLCDLTYRVSVYLVSAQIMKSSQDNMLDLIDSVISELHFTPIRVSGYFGRCLFSSFDFVGIFPGLSVYKLNFTIRT